MQVTLHAVFDNQQELANFAVLLANCGLSNQPVNPASAVASAAAKEKAVTFNQKVASKAEAEAKGVTKAAAKEEAKAETESDPAEAPPEQEKSDPLEPNYKNMKAAVLLLNRVKGREATETILKKYGGEKNGKLVVGPHVPEKHHAAIITEVNTILAKP